MEPVVAPDWLVPGAEVVLYSTGGVSQSRNVRRSTIAKVGKRTFTVDDEREPRFRIDRCSVDQGGTWGWTRNVVPIDSDVAREELAKARQRARVAKADQLYDAWRGTRAAEARHALIEALRAIED